MVTIDPSRLIFEIFYTLVAVTSSLIISYKVNRLYQLSMYRGFRYFRDAFLLFAFAFFIRLIMIYVGIDSIAYSEEELSLTGIILNLIFYYAISMGGFSLVYSLVWKRLEKRGVKAQLQKKYHSKIWLLHLAAIAIAFHVYLSMSESFMFLVQIAIHLWAVILIIKLYRKKQGSYMSFYLAFMSIALVGWTLNFFGNKIERIWEPMFIVQEVITAGLFVLILYCVLAVERKRLQ